jgi:cytochrome b involved in lipid metabolism
MGKGGKSDRALRVISREEVAKHNTEKDSWLIIRGRVYDVTNFDTHPGGAVMYTHSGRDASSVFQAFHSGGSYAYLDRYLVGEVKEPDSAGGFEADMDKLRAELVNRGFFKSRYVPTLQ